MESTLFVEQLSATETNISSYAGPLPGTYFNTDPLVVANLEGVDYEGLRIELIGEHVWISPIIDGKVVGVGFRCSVDVMRAIVAAWRLIKPKWAP